MKNLIRILLLAIASSASAAEITTNGSGGGPWSDPDTWRGKALPKADDEVTIRKGDTVVFDITDVRRSTVLTSVSLAMKDQPLAAAVESGLFLNPPKPHCAKLNIDPKGGLTFKKGIGTVVLVVAGPIESFGLIRLDGTGSAEDHHELLLTGKTPQDRVMKCEKGSAFVLAGKAGLPGGRLNVAVVSRNPDPLATDPMSKIDVKGGILDVQRAEFRDVALTGDDMDNTGTKPGERCNVIANRFLGKCNLSLISCDTPVVSDNLFDYPGGPWHQPAAIALNGCPLAEVKKNTVKGCFYHGFSIYVCTDAVVVGNSTDRCYVAFYCVGQTMFRSNTIREAGCGFVVTSMSGTMDDTVFEKTACGIHLAGATVQVAGVVFKDPPKDATIIDFSAGELTLINCDFGPEMVRLPKTIAKTDKPLVTTFQFLILKVDGKTPEDTQVDVRTVNPVPPIAPGAMDPNVRNSPAPIVEGRTPLPQSLSPIMLKGWVIDKDGKHQPALEYNVRVMGPAEEGKDAKVLKAIKVKPLAKWCRAKPDDPTPTVEVSLK